MAAKKSAQNPHQWPNGEWHSETWEAYSTRKAADKVGTATPGGTGAQIMAAAAEWYRLNGIPNPNAPAPAANAAAVSPAGPTDGPPPTPAPVDPFFTADDLEAINQFNTDLATKLEGIDFNLTNAETDTTFQKTQNDNSARGAASSATDNAIERGIFSSSVKDATIYDIEAQRSLSEKFLNDKLTTQRLSAGTNKQILGAAKTNFDTNMVTRKAQNAQGVNDANSSAWATAMAAWQANQPVATPASGPAPAAPSFKSTAAVKPPNTLFAATPTSGTATNNNSRPNTASGTGSTKPRVKTTKVVYGNTP